VSETRRRKERLTTVDITEHPAPKQKSKQRLTMEALLLSLAAVTLAGLGKEIIAQAATPSTIGRSLHPTATRSIVFMRPMSPREEDGDLWITSASGQHERRLTTGGHFQGLSSDGHRAACVGAGSLYILAPPDWRPQRVMTPQLPSVPDGHGLPPSETWLSGSTGWRTGTRQLFVGAGLGDAGDGGLWLVDIDRRTVRRALPPIDADFPLNDEIILSPGGTRVASGGYGEMYFWVRVLDLRTGRQIRQPAKEGILGMTDFAWLDEDNLLLAGSLGSDWEEKGHWEHGKGGIRRLNLRTGKITPWLYTARTSVDQVVRSPRGDRFAVVGDLPNRRTKQKASDDYIVLVDARTKSQSILSTPGPPTIRGFSPDGTQLLITVGTSAEDEHTGDAYILDIGHGGRRLVARGVMEAVWVEKLQGSVAGRPNLTSAAARDRGQG
jgi:hypothetical protein